MLGTNFNVVITAVHVFRLLNLRLLGV